MQGEVVVLEDPEENLDLTQLSVTSHQRHLNHPENVMAMYYDKMPSDFNDTNHDADNNHDSDTITQM